MTIKPLLLRILPPVLLALACLLVFYPGLSGGFLFDDFPNIVTNKKLQASTLTAQSLLDAARAYAPGVYGRPLATLGFAFDYALGGKDAWGYKVHSLALHVINALLVLALARRLLALPAARGPWPAWTAFVLALLWAIHPLQVSTVLYVVQRMEILSLTFVLLALLAYLRGRAAQCAGQSGWRWLVVAAGLAGLGMLSKETAALFPVYTLALEVTLLGFAAGSARTGRFLKIAYLVSFGLALMAFAAWVLPAQLAPEAYSLRDFTVQERLLTQLRVLPMYLGQMLLPLPNSLTFYYDNYPHSTGLLHPATTLAGGLLLTGLASAAIFLRQRLPLVSLGIFWFFASHLLTSNVINLELVFEHRNYFALFGVLLAVAGLLHRLPGTRDRSALTYGVVAIVIGFGLLATVRSATWGNPLLLATELVARNPGSARASSDLATLYIGMSDSNPNSPFFTFGKREFERAANLPNASPLPEQGLILMAATTGLPVDGAWWDSLIEKIESRPIGPQEVMAVTGLVQQRFEGVELDDDRLSQAYAALLARNQSSPALYIQYASFAITYLGDEALAQRLFVDAMDSPGMSREYAARIVAELVLDGRPEFADAVRARAIENGLLDE